MSRTQPARRRLVLAVVALAVAGVTACGSDGTDTDVSAGDPAYAYQVIADMHESSAEPVEPRSLVEALPNVEIKLKSDQGARAKGTFSDAVVAGRITKVTPDEGVFYSGGDPTASGDDEVTAKVVGFDNPDAADRTALVTLQVDWSAGAKVDQTLQFRMRVPLDTDANKFLAGVRGIDDAVVLLKKFEDGMYQGDYYPTLGFAGLGSVDDDGMLSFRGFGEDESAFLADVDTLDELKAAAGKPDRTVEY